MSVRTAPHPAISSPILFVELDGALLATNLSAESFFAALVQDPSLLLRYPWWRLRAGRAYAQRQIALSADLDAEHLPYRRKVLEFLRDEKARGRSLVLVTEADLYSASAVAECLELFDDILPVGHHPKGEGSPKEDALATYCRQHDTERFGYLGTSRADLAAWRRSDEMYVAEPSASLLREIRKVREPTRMFRSGSSRLRAAIEALRPRQWAKNLLFFIPLVVGHQVASLDKVSTSLLAFAVFCMCSSCVYLLNDLLDLQSDRRHPRKKNRPFASGRLPIAAGPPMALALLAGAGLLSIGYLPPAFLGVMAVYLALNIAYSFWLKTKVMVDVVLLSMMYTLRIVAAGAATGIAISEWLLAYCLFIFTSLAFAKRYGELSALEGAGAGVAVKRRGYQVRDIRLLETMGVASGYLSVLVLALYINSDQVKLLYENVSLLWLLCPMLLYWCGRLWIKAGRRELLDDPFLFALTDTQSWLIAALSALVLLAASFA